MAEYKQIEESFLSNVEEVMNGYNLTRNWFNYRSNNPHKCKSIHSEMYLYIVDLWNRLGQKEIFGLPTFLTMDSLNIGSRNTYYKTLTELEEFGFIKTIQESKNQHQSRLIAISKIEQPRKQALDQALLQAREQTSEHIVKPYNNKTNNNKPPTLEEFENYAKEKAEAIGIDIDLKKIRAKFYAWEGDGWKTGGKNPRKIKNWKSTLTNSLQYCKSEKPKQYPMNNYKSMI